jgi:ABC-type tungstate transport system permease subunit
MSPRAGVHSHPKSIRKKIAAIVFALFCSVVGVEAQERSITVASTTSTEQSGLFGYLLPQFSKAEGIAVKVVAVGTVQALDIVGGAMPTWSSFTTGPPRTSSWPKGRA